MKEILNFPGYKAGDDGHIYSFKIRERVDYNKEPKKLKGALDGAKRYLHISLRKNKKTFQINIHRLICTTFHGPPPTKRHTVSHEDGDRYNNKPDNLKWRIQKDNLALRVSHGTDDNGHKNSRALFSEQQVIQIRKWLSEKKSCAEIARIMNCNPRVIEKIKNGRRYARSGK